MNSIWRNSEPSYDPIMHGAHWREYHANSVAVTANIGIEAEKGQHRTTS